MQAKHPKDSLTTLTDIVLPGETNALNNLFGGELLARMDRACSIAAQRHCRRSLACMRCFSRRHRQIIVQGLRPSLAVSKVSKRLVLRPSQPKKFL